jgi:lipoprotein-anchoring transpeptidase ErfK/SrfK
VADANTGIALAGRPHTGPQASLALLGLDDYARGAPPRGAVGGDGCHRCTEPHHLVQAIRSAASPSTSGVAVARSPTEALRYPISVGREGFTWTGTETISRVAEWPDWHPPGEMRDRDPSLPEKMSGGIKNPLGAKALYLGNSLYRIHGTNDPRSIGRAASSVCFRMLNGHIVDLAGRAQIGTTVTVVNRLPPDLERFVADQVAPAGDRIGTRSGRPS